MADKREEIRFGTDGWRGIIANDFTFANVARLAQATAEFLVSPQRAKLSIYTDWGAEYRPATEGVIIGYDTRFLSPEFALYFARVLQDNGIPVALSDSPVPTPAISYDVINRRQAAGVMITASHNPSIYNGVKFKPEYGGSAPQEVTDIIESLLVPVAPTPKSLPEDITKIDLKRPLLAKIRTLIDPARLTAAPVLVVIDSMYGSAQGYAKSLLDEYDVSSLPIRATRNPLFSGINPEPLDKNLVALRAVIASRYQTNKRIIGVATDGDGDRISAMDECGNFIDMHRTFALILRYLVEERGWRGAVVKSFALTDMATKMCTQYGLPLIEVPIGFKYACKQILTRGDVLIAAEESGSIGVKGHIPDRDGILCSLLLAEIAATARGTISEEIENIFAEIGPHFYRRCDLHIERRQEIVAKLLKQPPERFAGRPVKAIERLDGLKLRFADGWLLLRASGTEPILRLYCEMSTRAAVEEVLDMAARFALT
ncbi:phosphoglucomutase/phosphomannomutase family protein [Candidatus Acetothermia bacterium]|jgi:phosphomannomutase|nr:phosphoglucomutase/phosphomannomutase family protein [Candidatus Acetothermia bacterium]MCI2427850.1 phosphoglucomutase/phosphomannomutase family protein [Candidatus Acetothermia bacterium]MCI2428949.1 phosphoglucomutase/phosphomannomutase family protein [Candidatus Acetothermia bacterium]